MKRSEQTRTELTRQRLLDVAAEEFAERGFAQSSASRIANRANLTRGSLYYHFTNKEALFEAVYIAQMEGLVIALSHVITDVETNKNNVSDLLINGFQRYFDYVERDTFRRICLIEAKSVLGVKRVFELDGQMVLSELSRGFKMMAEADLIGNISPELFGAFMIGIADQAALMLCMETSEEAKTARRLELIAAITQLIAGLRK